MDAAALAWADLVIVMDRFNWDRLAQYGEAARSKAVWLGAFLDGSSVEIVDPYGRPADDMQTIARRLQAAAQRLGACVNTDNTNRV